MMGPGVGRNVTSLIVDGRTCPPEEARHSFRKDRDFCAAKTEALKQAHCHRHERPDRTKASP